MNDDQNPHMNDDQNSDQVTHDDSQADDLNQKIKDAQAEADEKEAETEEGEVSEEKDPAEALKEALARSMADLQNYKRRSEQERSQFVKLANAELLKSLLPIFNNLNRSVQHLPEAMAENEWAKGVIHINTDLLKTLESLGVVKMKTVGEKLDPNQHEALMSGPGEKDLITEEFEPGYLMNGEIVKPAKVKVGDGS